MQDYLLQEKKPHSKWAAHAFQYQTQGPAEIIHHTNDFPGNKH